ncbi:alanine--tRNA ligase-related protein, partial [Tetragenococcus halophilus]
QIDVDSEYVGYSTLETKSTLALLLQNDKFVDDVNDGQAEVIFSQTPFYAEMGGQVADTGVIIDQTGEICATVRDVQKAPKGQYLHQIEVKKDLQKGQEYTLQVDKDRHNRIIKNHTATHLLHKALKEVLGSQSNQAGSLVAPDHLRFDFTHFGQITAEELQEMEKIVNEKIWQALPVTTIETDIDTAKNMGAMALFGEKYG